MKHRKIFAISSVVLLWILTNGFYREELASGWYEYFSVIVIAMGFVWTIGLTVVAVVGLLFLYNIYLACSSIFNFENKLRPTIYDGIAFGSFIMNIYVIIRLISL